MLHVSTVLVAPRRRVCLRKLGFSMVGMMCALFALFIFASWPDPPPPSNPLAEHTSCVILSQLETTFMSASFRNQLAAEDQWRHDATHTPLRFARCPRTGTVDIVIDVAPKSVSFDAWTPAGSLTAEIEREFECCCACAATDVRPSQPYEPERIGRDPVVRSSEHAFVACSQSRTGRHHYHCVQA